MGAAPKTKAVKNVSSAKASKSPPSHPPYIQMITEALTALKERTGSSPYAIAKHVEEEQKIKDLPANFRKLLFIQLKRLTASGKLVMVKKSFKLPPAASADKKVVKKPTAAAATTTAAKPKAKAAKKDVKTKSLKAVKSPMKKKAIPAVTKAKKPKSIKSPVKKAAAVAKKSGPAAKKAKK